MENIKLYFLEESRLLPYWKLECDSEITINELPVCSYPINGSTFVAPDVLDFLGLPVRVELSKQQVDELRTFVDLFSCV